MIVTEQEAKTKWCPEIRADGGSCNAGVQNDKDVRLGNCIGSGCMMWRARWRLLDADGKFVEHYYFYPPRDLAEGCTAQAVGYCGKAGKP